MPNRKKKRRTLPKISDVDTARVLEELDAWCRRERPGKLTWAALEDFSGFSRQSLSTHSEIKERYDAAKAVLRGKQKRTYAPKPIDEQVAALREEVATLKGIIQRYDERWARYALNAARLGLDIERLDAAMDPPARSYVRTAHRVGTAHRRDAP